MTHPPTLHERIEEVEARVVQRQDRVHRQWQETQHATRALVRLRRTLPLIAAGATVLVALVLLRRPQAFARTGARVGGGVLGPLAAAGLALIGPRYGALYSLVLQLLNRRSGSSRRN